MSDGGRKKLARRPGIRRHLAPRPRPAAPDKGRGNPARHVCKQESSSRRARAGGIPRQHDFLNWKNTFVSFGAHHPIRLVLCAHVSGRGPAHSLVSGKLT